MDEPPTASADPAALEPLEALVAERRGKLSDESRDGLDPGLWGLALSGGGIRSATFSFGLLKALAQNRIFHRFDLLSTVSGGGYVGATVGKLFLNAQASGQPPEELEQALADADTRWFAFWLRANGRYLIPRGGADLMFAAANFGRNLAGIHVEIALLSLLLGGLLVAFDLGVWSWADCVFGGGACRLHDWVDASVLGLLSPWPTPWVLLPPVLWAAATLSSAYWTLPAKAGAGLGALRWLVGVAFFMAAFALAAPWIGRQAAAPAMDTTDDLQLPPLLVLCAVAALLAVTAGTLVAFALTLATRRDPDRARNRLTGALGGVLRVALVIAGLGVVDVCAWMLANATAQHHGGAAAVIGFAVVVVRTVLPKIADLPRSLTPAMRGWLTGLISLAGWAAVLLLVIFWTSLVHRSATLALFDEQRRLLQYRLAWSRWAVIVARALVLVLVSWRNRDFLNRSSLYAFYRARLIRGYLGAANVARFPVGTRDATERYPRHVAAEGARVSVQDVAPGDDVPMAAYAPHRGGGPVHLLNVCVNQTCDLRGRLFNQDRKGLPMTIGPAGRVRVGQEEWRAVGDASSLSLGSWVAISGAAVAPGLGSGTRSGIAALLTIAGIRLGYWWDSVALRRAADEAVPPVVNKYGQLLAELRGRFDGVGRRDWYLSDGGHFENTAAYGLLREECALIVVADCGADPRYAFGDLENLVRKARIDLQAEITFLKPKLPREKPPVTMVPAPKTVEAANENADAAQQDVPPPEDPPADDAPDGPPRVFGSLNDLVSPESHACLALARVDYGRSGKVGHLVIVKPNMCVGVPVDLVNFKADNPLFPQEPTTDQFFSEAQWESYFQLGAMLGAQLDARFLRQIADNAQAWFDEDDGSVIVFDEEGARRSVAAPKRLPSRILATGAVTASLSLGALATLGTSVWQAVEARREALDKARHVDPAVLKELTDLYGKLAPPAGADAKDPRLGEMATALIRISDAACTDANTQAFKQSPLMQMILTNTRKSCSEANPRHPACDVLLSDDDIVGCLRKETRATCVPQYFVRDYGVPDPALINCPLPVLTGVSVEGGPLTVGAAGPGGTSIVAWLGSVADAVTAQLSPEPPPAPPSNPVLPPPPLPTSIASGPAPGGADATACAGKTIYLQVFGPEARDAARVWRDPWQALGATVPPIEDVADSARRGGRRAPNAPAVPTVIYHDAASQACAQRLQPQGAATPWLVTPLSARLDGTAGTIEVWIPPVAAGTGLPATGWCYQEDAGKDGAQRFGVHCHAERARCEAVRGPNPRRLQSACESVDLAPVADRLKLRGYGGSWYAMQASPFDPPFPQLPVAAPGATK